jgi:hypothetical protein
MTRPVYHHPTGSRYVAPSIPATLGYFACQLRHVMNGFAWYARTHTPPPCYPFTILGKPTWRIQHGEMYAYRDGLDILRTGRDLDYLVLQLRLLRAECAAFLVQREIARRP